jgi:hypothetical protein
MHLGFMDVILSHSGQLHASAAFRQTEDGHTSGQNMLVTTMQ